MASVDSCLEIRSTDSCKNILSVKHVLLECPFTTELFQKNGYDLNACNNVRDILYHTDVVNHIVRLIVHSPVRNKNIKKLCVISPQREQT